MTSPCPAPSPAATPRHSPFATGSGPGPALSPTARRACLALAGRWLTVASSLGPAGALLASCSGGDSAAATPPAPPAGPARITPLLSGLDNPWSLAFLPDGQMLVTQRGGQLRRLAADGLSVLADISGVPAVSADGQGGLLDVVLDPAFASTGWVYLSYSEPGTGAQAGLRGTAVARGQLVGNALQNLQVIYRQTPKVSGGGHYGSRLVFAPDGTLFIALGERQLGSPAQDLSGTLGKVVRIRSDGSIPGDNPSLGAGSRPEIWSYGHRNPQGIAIHPATGALWLVEHGPQGGDELNRVQRGGNHGWPLRSYGCNYGDPVGEACRIGGGTHAPDYVEPVAYWVPTSTAPSSLLFYTGAGFPEWQGQVFIGALSGSTLWRLQLGGADGATEIARDQPLGALGERVRCVRQGPDGWLYLLTDSGKLLRVDR